jgi:hypothetical protein
MNKEHTIVLFEENPQLYLDRDAMTDQSLTMFGFACGDGWFEIIRKLSLKLTVLIRSEKEPELRAIQVRERFGALSFNTNVTNDDIKQAIEEAVLESRNVCESCGDNGELFHRGGWLKTLCIGCGLRHGFLPARGLEDTTR